MTVKKITNAQEFQSMKRSASISVVDFFAEWCGPCKIISPYFSELSSNAEFASIGFFQIDVDELPEVTESEGIEAMPTFKIYSNGETKECIVGANRNVLINTIKKYAQ